MEKRTVTTVNRDKLFSVIRVCMGHSAGPIILSPSDCKELIQIGKRQTILPLIYRGLTKIGAPTDFVKECDRARLKDTKHYILQNDALNKISAALDKGHIPYIPLK